METVDPRTGATLVAHRNEPTITITEKGRAILAELDRGAAAGLPGHAPACGCWRCLAARRKAQKVAPAGADRRRPGHRAAA
jgi:hypothetical protein